MYGCLTTVPWAFSAEGEVCVETLLPPLSAHVISDEAVGLRTGGVWTMMLRKTMIGIAWLCLTGAGAAAFQETTGGTATPQAPVEQAPGGKVLDLGSSASSPAGRPSGTEVRIPGLGTLGVLPKLDFGLELLYGVNEDKRLEPEKGAVEPDDGVQIRGTLKHRF